MTRSWTRRQLIRLGGMVRRHVDYAIDLACDAALGIDTFIPVPREPIDPAARNGRYEPLPYRSMRTIGRRLDISRRDVVLDVGCGKGRVVCLFARRAARCIGVEISPGLAADAERNARRLRWRHCAIDIVTRDAVDADIDGASIVFLYNPFAAEVMRPVLAHIRQSLTAAPRELKICYANPVESALFDASPWLIAQEEFLVTHNGWHAAPVKIWKARPDPAAAAVPVSPPALAHPS
jgi:SAM-dependent methyltransferase